MLKRSVRAALSVAVVAVGTAVAFQLATGSASADDFAMELPIRGFSDVAVDGEHKRIFISDGTGGQLVTVDFDGKVLATRTGLPGLAALELSGDGSRLYAAWPDGGAILAFDPASSAEVARYATGGGPRTLAQAGGKLWFGDRDGLGSLDLSGLQPVVTTGKQMGGTDWTTVPGLAATPGRPDVIAAAGNTYQQGVYQLLDVTTTPPTVLASTTLHRNLDMAFTADGSRLLVIDTGDALALSGTDLSRVESYRSTGSSGAVAVRADGTIALPARDGVGLHTPGTSEAVREFKLQDPTGASLSLTGIDAGGLAWEPGGRRLFGIARKTSTAASNPGPWFSLQVLNTLRTVTTNLSVPAEVRPGQAYSVTGFVRPVPAGAPLVITRTDAATPGGRRVGPETVPEGGVFEFQDSQAAPGKVTYELKGTHSVGVRYRVRFAYLYAKSGDTANASSYGPYRYFTFTK